MDDEAWPPPEARLRAALWEAERRLLRHEYAAGAAALSGVAYDRAGREVVAGVRHLAAAGFRQQTGDRRRALRQLAHARRRLGPYLPVYEECELSALLDLVARALES